MGSKGGKHPQKRLIKRYSTLSEHYVSDSESNKIKTRKNSHSGVFDSSSEIRSSMESFTPYSKIPAIGERVADFKNINNRFMFNYHSDSDANRTNVKMSSKIPIYRSQSISNKSVLLNNLHKNLGLKSEHLLRRNTYVVLEPIVCLQDIEKPKKRPATKHSLNVTYTKLNKNDIKDKSIVFGQKLVNAFDSDSDISASDEMSTSSEKGTARSKANFNNLNYLLRNLKLSRSTESDLLLPKNNPWLL